MKKIIMITVCMFAFCRAAFASPFYIGQFVLGADGRNHPEMDAPHKDHLKCVIDLRTAWDKNKDDIVPRGYAVFVYDQRFDEDDSLLFIGDDTWPMVDEYTPQKIDNLLNLNPILFDAFTVKRIVYRLISHYPGVLGDETSKIEADQCLSN